MHRFLTALLLCALATPALSAESQDAKRAEVRKMRNDTLAQLYKARPEAKDKIAKAAGYGVFSNIGVQIVFLGGAGGRGLVVDHGAKKETYMKMGQAQVGLGLGIKDFRAVFVFRDAKTLQRFVDKGWEFGGAGDAAAKSGEKGGAASDAGSVQSGIEIYQLTEAGVILSAAVAGTKYWKDDELN